jgi:hypothetical protein
MVAAYPSQQVQRLRQIVLAVLSHSALAMHHMLLVLKAEQWFYRLALAPRQPAVQYL